MLGGVGKVRSCQTHAAFGKSNDPLGHAMSSSAPTTWEPYLKLIRENCSEALHILDRFHIIANMNKALDHVRAEETSRMKRPCLESAAIYKDTPPLDRASA